MNTVKDLAIALIVFVVMLVSRHILLPIVGDNWNLYGLLALICIFTSAFVVMIYYQYIDGYVRQAEWEKENESSTHTAYPDAQTTTWVLDTKFRELSDEEILEEWFYEPGKAELWETKEILNFARTVIRKAQER